LASTLAARGKKAEAQALAREADQLLVELRCDRFRSLAADEIQALTADP
jgi:hypothetical protein